MQYHRAPLVAVERGAGRAAQLVVDAGDARIPSGGRVGDADQDRRLRVARVHVQRLASGHGRGCGDEPVKAVQLERVEVQIRLHRGVAAGVVRPGVDLQLKPLALGQAQHTPQLRADVAVGQDAHRADDGRGIQRAVQNHPSGRHVEPVHGLGFDRAVRKDHVGDPAGGGAVGHAGGQRVDGELAWRGGVVEVAHDAHRGALAQPHRVALSDDVAGAHVGVIESGAVAQGL